MKHEFAGKNTFLVAGSGFLAGLLLFVLTGYRFYASAPPPLVSVFRTASPLAGLLSAWGHEALFPAAMGVIALFPLKPCRTQRRLLYGVLFLRMLFFSFSAAYLYGTHPSPWLYLSYVFPVGAMAVAEAAISQLWLAQTGDRRRKRWAAAAPAFFYFIGILFCLVTVLHLLLALCGC